MERIWFVHAKGRQEGPLSLEEVRGLIDRGDATMADFGWREGMAEWAPLAAISELASLFPRDDSDALSRVTVSGRGRRDSEEELSAIISIAEDERRERTDVIDSTLLEAAREEAYSAQSLETRHLPAGQLESEIVHPSSIRSKWTRIIKMKKLWAAFAVIFVGGAAGLVWKSGWTPFGSGYSSVADLTADENAILAFSGNSDFKRDGYRISFVLSQTDGSHPKLFVSGNFPDNELIRVEAKGAINTLLGVGFEVPRTDFKWEGRMNQRHFLLELPLQSTGNGLAAGEYEFLAEAPRLAVRTKKVFVVLAGLAQEAYGAQLRSYQTDLRKKVELESVSIKEVLRLIREGRNQLKEAYSAGKVNLRSATLRKVKWPKLDTALGAQAKLIAEPISVELTNRYLKRDWGQAKYLSQQLAHEIELYDSIVLRSAEVTAFEKGIQDSDQILEREGTLLLERINRLQVRIEAGEFPLQEAP